MTHPLEFIGMIAHRAQSEIHPPRGPAIDPGYIQRFAQAHEAGGFDRILVAWGSTAPDALLVAGHAAAATQRIGFMVALRPGFVAPTLAARQFATFDQLSVSVSERQRNGIWVVGIGCDSKRLSRPSWMEQPDVDPDHPRPS